MPQSVTQDFLFVNINKPFNAENISKEMHHWTKEHLGFGLGVRDWRQVSTPFRRTHAGLQETWLDDHETVDAAQAGHSHHVDHMRYGVTERSYTGLPEDYLGPYLETSVRWHSVLHLVPGIYFIYLITL